jgi:hypothetical protein
MKTTRTMETAADNDADLVADSLNGNRDAFEQIVARYQSLICSLAYSATGSLGHPRHVVVGDEQIVSLGMKRCPSLQNEYKLEKAQLGASPKMSREIP